MNNIQEFDPVIYPTRLWVTKGDVTIDELNEVFCALSDTENRDSFKNNYELPDTSTSARVYPVLHKGSRWCGCLVFLNRKDASLGVIAHEASHCTDWLFDELGIKSHTFSTGEARAYYLQWAVNCILSVRKQSRK